MHAQLDIIDQLVQLHLFLAPLELIMILLEKDFLLIVKTAQQENSAQIQR